MLQANNMLQAYMLKANNMLQAYMLKPNNMISVDVNNAQFGGKTKAHNERTKQKTAIRTKTQIR